MCVSGYSNMKWTLISFRMYHYKETDLWGGLFGFELPSQERYLCISQYTMRWKMYQASWNTALYGCIIICRWWIRSLESLFVLKIMASFALANKSNHFYIVHCHLGFTIFRDLVWNHPLSIKIARISCAYGYCQPCKLGLFPNSAAVNSWVPVGYLIASASWHNLTFQVPTRGASFILFLHD